MWFSAKLAQLLFLFVLIYQYNCVGRLSVSDADKPVACIHYVSCMEKDTAGPCCMLQFAHFGAQHLHCENISTHELECLQRTLGAKANLLT